MGGSGGGKKRKNNNNAPAEPQQINLGELMSQASMYGAQNSRDQIAALIEAYPQLEALQLGTVDRIAGRLGDSAYTRWAQGETQDASLAATRVTQTGQQQQTLGSSLAQQGMRQLADSGPTSIEQRLYADAERELALGRELSPEQQRAATQSARQAFAARGLGTGMGSAAAEILNRDAYATAREDSRRNFAASANNMQTQNVLARRAGATNEIGLGGNFLANATNAYNMGGALRLNTASAVAGLDPYARALGAAQPYVGNSLNSGGQMVGNAYNNALGMAGNAASFNTNMQSSIYNSYQNNQAAMNSARMQAGAANNSATMGMIGSGVGAAAGLAVIGIGI
jgi:hypothetical protein